MKKWFQKGAALTLAAALLTVSLTGCGNKKEVSSDGGWRDESPETATPEEIFDAALCAGLRVNTMHAPTAHTPELWRDTPGGTEYSRLRGSLPHTGRTT